MHWMTEVLRYALGKDFSQLSSEGLLEVLHGFARAKVADAYDASGAFTATGFSIPRIVLPFLDYLLADGKGPARLPVHVPQLRGALLSAAPGRRSGAPTVRWATQATASCSATSPS